MNARHQAFGFERADLGLLVLRAVVGIVFLAHGAQKIFSFGIDGTQAGFAEMGIPLAALAAPVVAVVELVGGLALILGLFSRWAAAAVGAVALGAFFLVHLPAGFFLPGGVEFVLTLFAAAAALVALGPGALSTDALLASPGEEIKEAEAPEASRQAA